MSNKNYITGNEEIDRLILELAEKISTEQCRERIRQILTTTAKLGMEHDDLGDFKLVNTTMKELRHAFRIFVPHRETRKVVVFGSARTKETHPIYKQAQEVSELLAQNNFMVVSGAGGGIMEAANRGAGKENSFGINIRLPFEQRSNPYIEGDPKLMTFKYFFTRKLFFIKETDATILCPGGFGTQDEGFEILTLFQTGKTLPRPIVLLEPEGNGYWGPWLDFVDSVLIKRGYISPEDRDLLWLSHSAREAADYIAEFYKAYHSLRYVEGKTVLRFTQEIPQKLIDHLNEEFSDIVAEGKIEASNPLASEIENKEHPDMPRLVFQFNRKSFGRLNQLILRINRSLT